MPPVEALGGGALAILTGAAFATGTLSAVLGMGGGLALMIVMLQFLDPLVAIPLHGAVQLCSNGSRTAIQRRHIHWPIVAVYALPLLPAGLVGVQVAQALPGEALRLAVGAFVLLVTWAPGLFKLSLAAGARIPLRRFFALGGASGFLNMTIGVSGPFNAPFFLDLGFERHAVIGTKAATQLLGHLCKVAVFGLIGFAFAPYLAALALLAGAVVAGTALGSWLLDKVSERSFVRVYRGVLTLLALRLVCVEGGRLLAAAS